MAKKRPLADQHEVAVANDAAELALLREVKEHYDEQQPLQTLIDWLDSHGAPGTADTIRFQVADDAMQPRPTPPQGKRPTNEAACQRREQAVKALVTSHSYQTARGMTRLYVMPERLMTGYLDTAIAANPLGWGWIDGLILQGTVTAGAMNWLLRWPRLAEVNHLGFDSCHLGLKRLRELAACPFTRCIADLALGEQGNTLSPEGIAALAETPLFAQLKRIHIHLSDAAEAMRILARVHLPRLQRLSFPIMRSGEPMGPAGAVALAGAGWLSGLQYLCLPCQHIGDEGAIALASTPALAGVRVLDLYGNHIGLDGARALADSPHLANLGWLRIYSNRMGHRGEALLRERFGDRIHY